MVFIQFMTLYPLISKKKAKNVAAGKVLYEEGYEIPPPSPVVGSSHWNSPANSPHLIWKVIAGWTVVVLLGGLGWRPFERYSYVEFAHPYDDIWLVFSWIIVDYDCL